MAEQTEFSSVGRASGPQFAAREEDAGRLDGGGAPEPATVAVGSDR